MNVDKFGRYRSSNRHRQDHWRNQITSPILNKMSKTQEGDISVNKCRIREIAVPARPSETDVPSVKFVRDEGKQVHDQLTLLMGNLSAELHTKLDNIKTTSFMDISNLATKLETQLQKITSTSQDIITLEINMNSKLDSIKTTTSQNMANLI